MSYETKLVETPYGTRQDYEDWELLDVPDIISIVDKSPVTFMQADNMQYLRWLKDNMKRGHFHLGIVDPPYGISVGDMKLGATANSKPREYEMGDWDNEVPTKEYWDLLRYCCRHLIVWGGNYFTKEIDWSGRCCLAWDKLNNGMSFADFELALTDFDESARIIRKSRSGGSESGDKRHPTMKPVYLYDYLHLNFVKKGERVLDTHGGSFTHAIAAFKNNINLTIMDRNKSYVDSGIATFNEKCFNPRLLF